MLCHPRILGDQQQRGTKSDMAASPLPSWGPKRGRKCYVTPPFSGISNKRAQNQTWLPHPCLLGGPKRAKMLCHPCILGHPCLLGGPKEGKNVTAPLHSRGSQTKGTKIRSGYLTPAFSGAQKRAEMLCHPFILVDPKPRGTKSDVATSPLPSWGHKRGCKCYGTSASSGINNKGEQNEKWLPHPCLLGPKRGPKCHVIPAFSGIPNKGEQNQTWLPHPCPFGGAKEVVNATSPLHSRASQTKGTKMRSGYLTRAFSGAQKRAEMLRHPCILGDRQQNGTKVEVATSPLPSRGPKRGRKCYATPAFSGGPKCQAQGLKSSKLIYTANSIL